MVPVYCCRSRSNSETSAGLRTTPSEGETYPTSAAGGRAAMLTSDSLPCMCSSMVLAPPRPLLFSSVGVGGSSSSCGGCVCCCSWVWIIVTYCFSWSRSTSFSLQTRGPTPQLVTAHTSLAPLLAPSSPFQPLPALLHDSTSLSRPFLLFAWSLPAPAVPSAPPPCPPSHWSAAAPRTGAPPTD